MERNEDYTPVRVRTGVYRLKEGASDKHLILIHGLHGDGAFDAEGDQMRDFYLALLHGDTAEGGDASLSALEGCTVWALTYNTMFMPFDISGSWLADELSRMPEYDFSGAIVVGYSMGGLIGRVLVAKGFNFKYLVTIDTPHQGPMDGWNGASWALFFLLPGFPNFLVHGVDSLFWGSGSQRLIHDSKLDQEKRKTDYAFYSTGYHQKPGAAYEASDDIVPVHSQLAIDDGDVRWRALWKKTYDEGTWKWSDLHSKASRPENCREVLDLVRRLLAGEPLPARTLDNPPATVAVSTRNFGAGKPALEIDGWSAWYWFDKHEAVQMRVALRVQNLDTKPLKLPLAALLRVQGGDVRPLESVGEIMLPPKASRKFVFAVDRPVNELLPEEVETVCFGERRTLVPMFVPFDLDTGVALPAESCWQLGLELGDVAISVSEDGYFTDVTVPMTVDNPSPCAFYLDHGGLAIRLDVTGEPFYDFLAESDVREDKRVKIGPAAKTAFSAIVRWPNRIGRPNKVSVTFGGSAMPAAQAEVAVGS